MPRRNLLDPLEHLKDDAILNRLEENLMPRDRRKGEKCPFDVILRLEKAGCPPEIVISFLFGYACGSDIIRAHADDYMRSRAEAAYTAQELERLLNVIDIPEAQKKRPEIRELVSHLGGTRNPRYPRKSRALGQRRLEWLAALLCFAECVGSRITEGELAALVWATVSAVRPEAKRIDTDTLAQALRRLWKRNPGFKEFLLRLIPDMLARYREEVRRLERRPDELLQP